MSQSHDRELCERIAHKMREGKPAADINVLGLVKGKEHYWFTYADDQRADALRHIGAFAGDVQLSFSWYDCAVLSQKIRDDEHAACGPVNRMGAI